MVLTLLVVAVTFTSAQSFVADQEEGRLEVGKVLKSILSAIFFVLCGYTLRLRSF